MIREKVGLALLVALAAFSSLASAADTKISALPAGSALGGTEAVPAVQSAATVKTTPAAISTYVVSQITSSTITGKFSGTCDATTYLRGDGACNAGAAPTSGTFTATYTVGFTVNQTQTFAWSKTGNIVTLMPTAQANGTSNNANLNTAAGDAPAAIRPTVGVAVTSGFYIQDNGTVQAGCLRVAVDGTISWGRWSATGNPCTFTNWTTSGTKLIGNGSSGTGISAGTYIVP